jgi:hypothetical protein
LLVEVASPKHFCLFGRFRLDLRLDLRRATAWPGRSRRQLSFDQTVGRPGARLGVLRRVAYSFASGRRETCERQMKRSATRECGQHQVIRSDRCLPQSGQMPIGFTADRVTRAPSVTDTRCRQTSSGLCGAVRGFGGTLLGGGIRGTRFLSRGVGRLQRHDRQRGVLGGLRVLGLGNDRHDR